MRPGGGAGERRRDEDLFVGGRPYEQADARIFFGREHEARDLVSLVIANPLLLLYAPSGAGKTSLINARVIPMLGRVRDEVLVPLIGEGKGYDVLPTARVSGIVPEGVDFASAPGANIYAFNTLVSWQKDESAPAVRGGGLVGKRLADYLDETRPRHPASGADEGDDEEPQLPRIAVFDQFEEIFTSHAERWEDREGFFEQVSDALRGSPVLFRARDIRRPGTLLARLSTGDGPVYQVLRERLSDAARRVVTEFAGAPAVPAARLKPFVESLNEVVGGESIYDEGLFRGVALRDETRRQAEREAKKASAGREKKSRSSPLLNRMLLEDAYPDELYRRSPGDRALRVVFSMREDYIAELDPYAGLLPDRLGTRYRLERLRRDAALAAVKSPLRYARLRFAEGVAERLVENLLKTPVRDASGAPRAEGEEGVGHG